MAIKTVKSLKAGTNFTLKKGIICPDNGEGVNKGKTKLNLFGLFDYGMNGIISHSTILLRLSTIIGTIVAIGSFGLIVLYIILKLVLHNSPHGITSLMIFILFFSGIQMIFLGIIGEYIAKIFNQSIEKPLVIEKELINFEQDK